LKRFNQNLSKNLNRINVRLAFNKKAVANLINFNNIGLNMLEN